jgi:sensor histidine kinase regulating citrate/malate metabolism
MNISFWREATFRQQLILVIVLGVSFLVTAASVLSAHIGGKRFADAVMQQGMANAQQLAQDSSLALIYESRQDAERVVQSAFAFNGTLVAEIGRAHV